MLRDCPNEPAQSLTLVNPSAAGRAFVEMTTDIHRRRCIELVVEIAIQVPLHMFATHRRVSMAAVNFSTAISRSRPRARRDMTVPIGTRTTAAISL